MYVGNAKIRLNQPPRLLATFIHQNYENVATTLSGNEAIRLRILWWDDVAHRRVLTVSLSQWD